MGHSAQAAAEAMAPAFETLQAYQEAQAAQEEYAAAMERAHRYDGKIGQLPVLGSFVNMYRASAANDWGTFGVYAGFFAFETLSLGYGTAETNVLKMGMQTAMKEGMRAAAGAVLERLVGNALRLATLEGLGSLAGRVALQSLGEGFVGGAIGFGTGLYYGGMPGAWEGLVEGARPLFHSGAAIKMSPPSLETSMATLTYTHDAAGNRTQVNHPDTTIDYFTWDARSLMVLADAGGNVVTNTFNAPGQRVGKETSGGTTHFRYDGQNLIQEADGSDDLTASYTTTDEEYGDLISEHDFMEGVDSAPPLKTAGLGWGGVGASPDHSRKSNFLSLQLSFVARRRPTLYFNWP